MGKISESEIFIKLILVRGHPVRSLENEIGIYFFLYYFYLIFLIFFHFVNLIMSTEIMFVIMSLLRISVKITSELNT